MDNTLMPTLKIDQLALLEFDKVTLGFPQSQVITIESLSNVHAFRATEKSSGTVSYDSAEIPVYTFNNDLTLLDKPDTNNRFCIAIKHADENESFAVMCDVVKQYITEDNTNIKTMPPLMHNPESPVIGLVKKEDSVVLISTAESMRTYINSQDSNPQEEQ